MGGSFSGAAILVTDVLRFVDRFDGLAGCPACRDYIARVASRPSFVKAHAARWRILLQQTGAESWIEKI